MAMVAPQQQNLHETTYCRRWSNTQPFPTIWMHAWYDSRALDDVVAFFLPENTHTHITYTQRDAFVATDRKFYIAAREQGHACGTTALAALVWGSTVYIANAGDSRAVLCRDGKPLQLTQDHRPSCQEELRRVEAHGGFVCPEARVNGHLAVTRAIGDFSSEFKVFKDDTLVGPLTAEPDVVVHQLTRGDEFLVLACDGLFDMFSSERVVELARDSLKHINDPQQCCKELVCVCFVGGW